MTTAVAVKNQAIVVVRDYVKLRESEIIDALPKHIDSAKMIRVFMTTLQKTPALLKCEPRTLFNALIECSQLGLMPDGVMGQAYIVPFGQTAQLIPGYRGLIDLAYRTGQISTIKAVLVWVNESFVYTEGLTPRLDHAILPPSDRGDEIKGAYARCVKKDRSVLIEFMWKEEIDAIRDSSPGAKKKDSPWNSHYGAMAKKTVIRQLSKWMPQSAEHEKFMIAATMSESFDPGRVPMSHDEVIDITHDTTEETQEISQKIGAEA